MFEGLNFKGFFIFLIVVGVIIGIGMFALGSFLFDHLRITVEWVTK